MRLAELQSQFQNAILTNAEDVFAQQIHTNGLMEKQRLQIYQNNFSLGLTSALQSIYPMIQRLVGEDFFRFAANQYLRTHPSTSGDLGQYGHDFTAFLQNFEPAKSLLYLPDMARLEWNYHEVFHAADAGSLDLASLSSLRETDYNKVRFHVHPASRLIASNFPLLKIWQLCQKNADNKETVDLNSGETHLLVIRRHLEIELEELNIAEFTFLSACSKNATLTEACNVVLQLDPDFEIGAYLQQQILRGNIVSFSIP